MPRIAIATPMLPVPFDQTRGRYIHEIARSLSRMADVRVYFMQRRHPKGLAWMPKTFLHGTVGEDYSLPDIGLEAFSYPTIPVLSRPFNSSMASNGLLRRVRPFEPDLLLAYWVYPDGHAALRVARRLGIPCVIGALGSDIHVRSGLNALMTRRTIAGADALVVVSEAMRQAAIARFRAAPAKVHTIVNGYNTAIFQPRPQRAAREQLGVPQDAKLIVYTGRFVETKGLRELIDAFAALAESDPATRLALVGDGVMREEVDRLVRVYGLDGRVLRPGGLEPERLARWIGAADVLTLPSWSEGYPNAVVEALACGRPVVATDVGGTREIVTADNGILIPPRDPQALHAALAHALARPWDHAAIAASMRRSWADVARETLAVCEQVLAQRAAAAVH